MSGDREMKNLLEDEHLEKILLKYSDKKTIQSVKERKSNKIVNQGDNYVSLTWQEVVQVTNVDGQIWEQRLIVKCAPEGELAREFIEKTGAFKNEILMYTEVLPKMEKLIKSTNCGETLWPKFVGMKPYSLILLEDLTCKGYQKVNRLKGLDLEHATLAIKALAKFHVLSIALKDELKLDSEEFSKFSSTRDSKDRFKSFKTQIQTKVDNMRNTWHPKWRRFADHIEENSDEIMTRFKELYIRKDENFNVLNHGDPWTSNILFKYSEFNGRLSGIKFVDYQMRHYGSFAFDLLYLFSTSVQANVLRQHRDDLIISYHESLLSTARQIGLTNIVIPSSARIRSEMKDMALYGIVIALYILDIFFTDPSDAVDLNTLLERGLASSNNKLNESIYYNEKLQAIFEPYIDSDLTTL